MGERYFFHQAEGLSLSHDVITIPKCEVSVSAVCCMFGRNLKALSLWKQNGMWKEQSETAGIKQIEKARCQISTNSAII